ncbi:MAG: hypothetical protein KF699_07355 [Phycisphaeraceae bacterium]|nr:hypothetical protein [Phycisphaeraceae bacterium]MBX3405172.1 hypothetical protein [Phycisphaeraceae bacterium]
MNRFCRHTMVVSGLALAAGLLVFAGEASAQSTTGGRRTVEKLEPPVPGQAKTDGIVFPMLLGIVLAGATVAVNLIPSKRGHQD